MTGRTLLQHFIKLLFLWGFLHFHWNEQVSTHDLFCNELWWIFLSTLKWAVSSVNPKNPPPIHMAINPLMYMQEGRIMGMKDNHICMYINIYFCLSVITLNCLQHSECLLKVRYCIEFKILLCWAGKEKKSNTFWIGPKYPRLIFWESCSS